jgi:hypothetical protein
MPRGRTPRGFPGRMDAVTQERALHMSSALGFFLIGMAIVFVGPVWLGMKLARLLAGRGMAGKAAGAIGRHLAAKLFDRTRRKLGK